MYISEDFGKSIHSYKVVSIPYLIFDGTKATVAEAVEEKKIEDAVSHISFTSEVSTSKVLIFSVPAMKKNTYSCSEHQTYSYSTGAIIE